MAIDKTTDDVIGVRLNGIGRRTGNELKEDFGEELNSLAKVNLVKLFSVLNKLNIKKLTCSKINCKNCSKSILQDSW